MTINRSNPLIKRPCGVQRSGATSFGAHGPTVLVPGRTYEKRLTNSSILTVLLVVMPIFFWSVDFIFEEQ